MKYMRVGTILFVSLLLWGTKRLENWPLFLIGGLIYEGIFGMMCLSYWKSLTAPS